MGMYTEFILGATLKAETPDSVINTLRYMVGHDGFEEYAPPDNMFGHRGDFMFDSSSYYFGVSEPICKMWNTGIDNSGSWAISVRSSLKNYDNEIERFCDWLRPWVEQGSGTKGIFALSIYEEDEEYKTYIMEPQI